MRFILIPLAFLAASMPMLAHDHGHGCWRRPAPRVVVVERPWRGDYYEPRVVYRHGWRHHPAPMWVERDAYCEAPLRPGVRLEFNLR